jgi:hypothetical protein
MIFSLQIQYNVRIPDTQALERRASADKSSSLAPGTVARMEPARSPHKERMDRFVASLLAMMDEDMTSRSRGALRPSFAGNSFTLQSEQLCWK